MSRIGYGRRRSSIASAIVSSPTRMQRLTGRKELSRAPNSAAYNSAPLIGNDGLASFGESPHFFSSAS